MSDYFHDLHVFDGDSEPSEAYPDSFKFWELVGLCVLGLLNIGIGMGGLLFEPRPLGLLVVVYVGGGLLGVFALIVAFAKFRSPY